MNGSAPLSRFAPPAVLAHALSFLDAKLAPASAPDGAGTAASDGGCVAVLADAQADEPGRPPAQVAPAAEPALGEIAAQLEQLTQRLVANEQAIDELRRAPAPASGDEARAFLDHLKARGFMPRGLVDVGAGTGDWTRTALSVFPDAPILLIEPRPEKAVALTALAGRPGCHVVQDAAIDGLLDGPYRHISPDLARLDMQGDGLEALAEARPLYGRTELFIVEMARRQPTPPLRQAIAFMAARGYAVYDILGCSPADRAGVAFVKADGMFRGAGAW